MEPPKPLKVEDVFGALPSLETPRLLLRRLRPEDEADIFAYASDPEVARYVPWEAHNTIEDTRAFLKPVLDLYRTGQVALWGMVLRQEGRVIGTCALGDWSLEHARAEIGFALGRQHWNQGLMTEAVREMIAFGFRVMRLNRIEARCEVLNIGSARVMEKAGMTYEGVLRQHVSAKGAFRDMKIYSILRREWEAAQRAGSRIENTISGSAP